jgi:hypothetical protein
MNMKRSLLIRDLVLVFLVHISSEVQGLFRTFRNLVPRSDLDLAFCLDSQVWVAFITHMRLRVIGRCQVQGLFAVGFLSHLLQLIFQICQSLLYVII